MFLDFGDESENENYKIDPSESLQNSQKMENSTQVRHAIALECIFYQKDCYYYDVKKSDKPVNRMGTENYKNADFDNQLEDMTFDRKPSNFTMRRDKTYTQNIDHYLMNTEKREAQVEYFLTKWEVNQRGGIMKTH